MATRRAGFWKTAPGVWTGAVGCLGALLAAGQAIKPEPIEVPVKICSGNACQLGDWPVGVLHPVGKDGDCSVDQVAKDIPDWAYVDTVKYLNIEPIIGAASDFHVTNVAMHPNANDNPSARKNLELCGFVPDTQDRRANVRVQVSFKWWSRLVPRI